MTIPEYLLFAALTVPLTALGLVFWMFNPLAWVVPLAALLVRAVGRDPGSRLGAGTAELIVLAVWPLTLAPVHFVACQLLGWPGWAFGLLFFATGFALAFGILLMKGTRRSRPTDPPYWAGRGPD